MLGNLRHSPENETASQIAKRKARQARRRLVLQAKKAEHAARKRARRAADPETARAKDRERRQREGAHIDALARARRAANPEPRRAADRKRLGTPKRKAQAQAANQARRARKSNAEVRDLSPEQWQEILVAFDFRCAYCPPDCWRCRRKKHALTQDHVTPYAHNGSHTLWNVVPACKPCNSRKGTRPPPVPVQPLLLTVAPAKKRKAS